MFKFFRRNKKKGKKEPRRTGIPQPDEKPRIASTVTTRLSDGTPIPEPEPEPEPQPILVEEPEPEIELSMPGPDEIAPVPPEIAAKFAGKSPEEICEIEASMPVDEIRGRLAKLFLRHNRAASSFDLKLRAEAEIMLAAIVTVREKYIERL